MGFSYLRRLRPVEADLRLTIDGIDIRDTTLSSLRQAIGTVQQDVFLFSATIRDK